MTLALETSGNFGLIRALHIDDNAFDRKRLKRVTDETGLQFFLRQISEPYEFNTALDEEQYDIIYLDYHLSGSTGLDLIQLIRRHPKNWDAALILITGEDESRTALEALRIGVSEYLVKDQLSIAAFERATVNAVQKIRLQRAASDAEVETKSVERKLKHFAELCGKEMQPMLARMKHQVRQMRTMSSDDEIMADNIKDIESTCARMDEFLQDLGSLADESTLTRVADQA